MSHLVKFDTNGAFGPAMTLMYNYQSFSDQGVIEITQLLKANFKKMANKEPEGDLEFSEFVNKRKVVLTQSEIISTQFFQSMTTPEPSPLHDVVLNQVVPRMLKTADEEIAKPNRSSETPQDVKEWLARFVECYMTADQIKKYYEPQNNNEQIMTERKNIGIDLSKSDITETDLDALIEGCQSALSRLKNTDHFVEMLKFTGRYLTLFSMNLEDPFKTANDVLSGLSNGFRKKIKASKDSLSF